MAKGRILLVDDLPEWQDTLADLLRMDDFEVDVAESLDVAIQRLSRTLYHVAIIDLRLVDWDTSNIEGMTILDEINRRFGKTDAIEKIMISAYSDKRQLREAFRKHEIYDFILKEDFNDEEFREIVRQAFIERVRVNIDLDVSSQ